jgi:hypothetical protein
MRDQTSDWRFAFFFILRLVGFSVGPDSHARSSHPKRHENGRRTELLRALARIEKIDAGQHRLSDFGQPTARHAAAHTPMIGHPAADSGSDPAGDLITLNREKAHLRLAGVIILVVGLISAGLLYWLRTNNSNLDQLRDSQARAESRQMQLLYGSSGSLTSDLTNALKRPANQAILIALVSALVAGGCFYLGQPLPETDTADPQ